MHDFLLSQQFSENSIFMTAVNQIDKRQSITAMFSGKQNVEHLVGFRYAKYEVLSLKDK